MFGDCRKDHPITESMRELWKEHVRLTRLVIVGLAKNNDPKLDDNLQELLDNQIDIGNALIPYYGETRGKIITSLLKQHILIAGELIKSAKEGNPKEVKDLNHAWYVNADEIASKLSNMNPVNWEYGKIRQAMHDHLFLTFKEAEKQLQGDVAESRKFYDAAMKQILGVSDVLSCGVINQFSLHINHLGHMLYGAF